MLPNSTSRWRRRRASRFSSTPIPSCIVNGNRELIGQALANLVDNALKYGAPKDSGGARDVRIEARRQKDAIELSVADHGPGIPAADRERVLERFVRLEGSRSRPGSGLGLSLAAAVARLHNGEVRIEDNAPGLRVTIVIPAAGEAAIKPGCSLRPTRPKARGPASAALADRLTSAPQLADAPLAREKMKDLVAAADGELAAARETQARRRPVAWSRRPFAVSVASCAGRSRTPCAASCGRSRTEPRRHACRPCARAAMARSMTAR